MDLFSVLKLVLGLSFFLFGMHVMSTNLEKMAGGRLEHLLKMMTAKPLVSLALGAAITIAVQSSSAVTVMLVGLVNSGIMQFSQTIYVIFGANIGTTLTAWILSLSGIKSGSIWLQLLKPENFSPILAFIGILLLMLSKQDRRKSIGTVLVGFTILMYGMEFMTQAVSPLAEMPGFSDLLIRFNNPIFGVVVGALFTALIQSSAASVGVLQALSLTGSLTYQMAIPIVMGQNIGTCVTSMISSIGTNANAKRVAAIHLSINVIGTAICLSVYTGLGALLDFGLSDQAVSPLSIALIHTIFNVVITVVLMPFSRGIIRLAKWLVPEKKADLLLAEGDKTIYAPDLRLLRSPSVAIRECENCTIRMAETAGATLLPAISLFFDYQDAIENAVMEKEDILDQYEDQLDTYLVYLSAQALSSGDSRKVAKMQHAIGDFERLGDHAVNLQRAAREMRDKAIGFSEQARGEITILTDAIREILRITILGYLENSLETARMVEPLEQVIDQLAAQIKENHVSRLHEGNCSIEMGFILSDLLTNYERISDHCSNIAVAVIEEKSEGFDSHRYLNGIKSGDEEFQELFRQYCEKFKLA